MAILRLVPSQIPSEKTSNDSAPSLTLLSVRSKTLPIGSVENWRLHRVMTRIARMYHDEPDDFLAVERLVNGLAEEGKNLTTMMMG